MSRGKIEAAEFPVKKVFSNDFNFRIPMYQRPYSWGIEQASELFEDILGFTIDEPNVDVAELGPFFLGSIVLIKEDSKPAAEVIDGQQRLTTLTILLSALRHTILDPQVTANLTRYLYEEGNPLEGNPNRYRLTLRERDADFFRKFVQDPSQLDHLISLDNAQLSDSQRNIKSNAELFVSRLRSISESERVRLAKYLVQNCLLVIVSTSDFDAAYRIFSILNDRGLDLSHSDILKSEIIGKIPPVQQALYSKLWEDTEEALGRQSFGDIFGHIRMIYRKQKLRESILKKLREHVVKRFGDSAKLIDLVLVPFGSAMSILEHACYESTELAEQINASLRWLNRIDNTDWIPPALSYLSRMRNHPKHLNLFFKNLERLAAYMMIVRVGIGDRYERYGKLLAAIEEGIDVNMAESPLQLSDQESIDFLRELNGDVYRLPAPRRNYLLLRLDSALSDGSATYDHKIISIEHVLPQTPGADSKWCKWFPHESLRERWVHRLGNLVLLTHAKNSSASNFEFDKKKQAYFGKNGVSPFPLTTQVVQVNDWTPDEIERLQRSRLDALRKLWRLPVDLNELVELEEAAEVASDESGTGSPVMTAPELVAILGGGEKVFSRSIFILKDGRTVMTLRSRLHPKGIYWYGITPSQLKVIDQRECSHFAFGMGTTRVAVVPVNLLKANLDHCWVTKLSDGSIKH